MDCVQRVISWNINHVNGILGNKTDDPDFVDIISPHQWSTGIEILSRPGPGRDDTHPGRDRDRDRDRNEIPAGTGISFIPAGTGTGTGIFPLIFTIC